MRMQEDRLIYNKPQAYKDKQKGNNPFIYFFIQNIHSSTAKVRRVFMLSKGIIEIIRD